MASQDLLTGRFVSVPLSDRIWDHIDQSGDCWEWTGGKRRGYGHVSGQNRESLAAHRVVYEMLVGPIPDGLTLDHLCSNTSCVNPDHLDPVTIDENLKRAPSQITTINARKTHCIHGHEFTAENTYHPPKRPRRRYCRTCQVQRS